MNRNPCIAIVSPFLDKKHGTERCVAEQAERLARDHGFEVHLFTERVDDIPGVVNARDWQASRKIPNSDANAASGSLVWHRVPDVPGPQLVKYLWWLVANHFVRWAARQRGTVCDLTYTPGINCFDADLISVHIVFAEFVRQVGPELTFRTNPAGSWLRLAHRRLYYRLLMSLERRIYGDPDQQLVVVSNKVAEDLRRFYSRSDSMPLVYHGLDLERFSPQRRMELRPASRQELGLPADAFALLLIGNDFRKKGLRYLLQAAAQLNLERLHLLVVGEDDAAPYQGLIHDAGLKQRVRFLPIRLDVEFYYAAADLYVGPSLEDAFSLPLAEAMACGVPAIVSRRAGVSEIISHGADGFVVEDPTDVSALAEFIRRLMDPADLREAMGGAAARTARRYTWEQNVAEMKALILKTIAARARGRAVEQFG
jgi:glycosyltransferase involved in cell wall biosynthesis